MYYDYREETAENIRKWLEDNRENIPEEEKESEDTLTEYLNDELRTEDSITWNGSWSYTFNSFKAKQYLEENEELLNETINEFCINMWEHWNDYEYLDVSIRCFILSECINRVIENCTRTCDNCGKIFIEWYICEDAFQYYCSEKCLEESLTEEETMEDLKLWEDNSPNYRTSRIECLD